MGNTEMFIVALGCLIAVFAVLVLYAITLVIKLNGMTNVNHSEGETIRKEVVQEFNNNTVAKAPVQNFNDSEDEEERLVVALAASAMVANDKPDSHFHISRITRIK